MSGKLSYKQPRNVNEQIRFTQKIVKEGLRNVAAHHVNSFNYAFETCLPRINQYMLTTEIAQPPRQSDAAPGSTPKKQETYPFDKMTVWFEDFELRTPTRSGGQFSANNVQLGESSSTDNDKLFPYECRLRGITY